MKNKKYLMLSILSLFLMISMFAGRPITVHAEDSHVHQEIALTDGFFCLDKHKETPYPWDHIDMEAIPSTEYRVYSQTTLDKVAAAVILRGDYYRETNVNINPGDLQAVIWAITCYGKTEMGTSDCPSQGTVHLNGNDAAKAYHAYVLENYESVIDKYTMTIWVSSDPAYQDILEAKMIEKHAVPSVEKKVKDRNDSESSNFDPFGWQDSADYDIGDSIPFQITASLRDMTGFHAYYLEFSDKMTHLTLDKQSLHVTIDGEDKTSGFSVDWNTNTKELNIKCDDVLALGATTNSKVVVTYNATLDGDASLGFTGNPNEVKLIYSRATGSADRGITPSDKVIVFTYETLFNKTNSNNQPLTGAAFELFKWIADDSQAGGTYISLGVKGAKKNEDGTYSLIENYGTSFDWKGIDDGQYKIVEVVTPTGYNTIEPFEFKFSALHDHYSENPELHYLYSDKDYHFDNFYFFETENEYRAFDSELITTIENKSGAVLPSTGGMGTKLFYLFGGVMVLVAGVLLVSKKRVHN